jgi:prepilin-type N-terminal cleavage/methylation domain-containing protein
MLISFRRFLRSFSNKRGFTLIELLVVTAIIVIITAFVLLRQGRFDSSTLLRSLTYSVALTVRQAQVYGVSVRGSVTTQENCTGGSYSAGTCFASAYGVQFNNASSYLLFADINGSGEYEQGIDAVVQTFKLGRGFKINKFCGNLTLSGQQCWTADPADSDAITSLTIIFRRPNPDACIAAYPGNDTVCTAGSATPANPFTGAYIQLSAIDDASNTHAVQVSDTGQIEVLGSGQ